MTPTLAILLAVALPTLGSVALLAVGRTSEQARNWLAFALVAASLACSASLLTTVAGPEAVSVPWSFSSPLSQLGMPEVLGTAPFRADRLAVFMALVSSLVGSIIVLYSFGYIEHYANRNEYYFLVVLFLGSMMGLVYANNLLLIYVFWEITAFACWRLIGFFRDEPIVRRADKAFLITLFGSLMMLLGFFAVFTQAGSFELTTIHKVLGHTPVSDLAVGLILCGLLAKSATLPLHTWLPDAGVAPSPVTALLHAAVLVKIGVYVYARLFIATFDLGPVWHAWNIIPIIAGISAFVTAGAALVETDIKRIIAYSTVSQLGFIFVGLAINNEVGVAGGLLYILMHSIAKGGLFLCAGIVEHQTHTKDIRKLGGLIKTMPITAVSFLLCALSVMGVPPFGGFFSKSMVLFGVASNNPWLGAFFVLSAVLTMVYLLRVFALVFLGKPQSDDKHIAHAEEGSPLMVYSVALLGALSLLSGVLIHVPGEYVANIVTQIVPPAAAATAANAVPAPAASTSSNAAPAAAHPTVPSAREVH